MATTSAPSTWTVVREILSANPSLTTDEVMVKAKAKGVKVPDAAIRGTVHNVRSELKKAALKSSPSSEVAVPTPKVAATEPKPAPAPVVVAPAPSSTGRLAGVLSNVALVNAAVSAAGGVEQARKVAEAMRACGGPDQFAQYLDLVAGIRTN